MRLRTFSAWGFGFAAGVLLLALTMWWTGRLTGLKPPPAVSAAAPPPAVSAATPTPVQPETSTRLAMPVAGVDPSKLHSNFEEMRGGHRHEALDITAPRGTPVMAVAQGNVARLFTSEQGGLTVYQFDDSRTLCYYYAHLDRYASGVIPGTLLRKGDILGYVGATGNASPAAPHLHFAIFRLGPEKQWWKGTAVDPLPFFQ